MMYIQGGTAVRSSWPLSLYLPRVNEITVPFLHYSTAPTRTDLKINQCLLILHTQKPVHTEEKLLQVAELSNGIVRRPRRLQAFLPTLYGD